MNRAKHIQQNGRKRLKTLAGMAGAGVVVAMGTLTAVVGGSAVVTGNAPMVVAGTTTSTVPPSTPTTPSAAPTTKATKFQGADWPGQ